MNKLLIPLICASYAVLIICAPLDPKKKETDENLDKKVEKSIVDLGLEYDRYLQEVIYALSEDKEFAKKMENISSEHLKSGLVAKELNFVSHNIRTKLDELKRIELSRLRKLTKKEHDLKEIGSYSEDGRKWRTLDQSKNMNDHLAQFEHIDHKNPHTFEVQDLHNLIIKATQDLEELEKKRREEFKTYEMEKEHQFRESLKNMTEDQKKEAIKQHDEALKKHKEHPRVHRPGSKQQLEEVWEEQDHLPKEEFDSKVFFAMHDINNDGYLDPEEVEALLSIEVKKMYDTNNPEDDPNEMMEEYHRMREYIYKEADKDNDKLISKKEFIELTQKNDFDKDEGWKGIDEQQIYTEEELRQYEQHRQEMLARQYGYQYFPTNQYSQQAYQNLHYQVDGVHSNSQQLPPHFVQYPVQPIYQQPGQPVYQHPGQPIYQQYPPQHQQAPPHQQPIPIQVQPQTHYQQPLNQQNYQSSNQGNFQQQQQHFNQQAVPPPSVNIQNQGSIPLDNNLQNNPLSTPTNVSQQGSRQVKNNKMSQKHVSSKPVPSNIQSKPNN